MISGGVNLVYYYDINAKINFLETLLQEYKKSDILFLDFDTQFTSFQGNDLLDLNFKTVPSLEIFLPHYVNKQEMVDKIIKFNKCNSIIILDSLNGLMDYFILSTNSTDTKKKKHLTANLNKSKIYSKSAGYKSLNFLNFLFGQYSLKNIPVVVTSYQSHTSIDRLKSEIISNKTKEDEEINHFRRMSNAVFLVEYCDQTNDTFVTILKENTLSFSPNSALTKDLLFLQERKINNSSSLD